MVRFLNRKAVVTRSGITVPYTLCVISGQVFDSANTETGVGGLTLWIEKHSIRYFLNPGTVV
jgi:hypothetical protein